MEKGVEVGGMDSDTSLIVHAQQCRWVKLETRSKIKANNTLRAK